MVFSGVGLIDMLMDLPLEEQEEKEEFLVCLPSEMSLSRISQAKIVGFSLLYCSILETTAGVATFGFDPPMRPGGLSWPIVAGEEKEGDA